MVGSDEVRVAPAEVIDAPTDEHMDGGRVAQHLEATLFGTDRDRRPGRWVTALAPGRYRAERALVGALEECIERLADWRAFELA